MKNNSIKLKEILDINDFNDINNLQNICTDYDKTHLKIEIDYKLGKGDKNSENMNFINEFMFYDDNKLVGYAGICDFGGDEIEINGMVHPDYRGRGIFTRLFSLVKDEFYKRDNKAMLLLSDNNSIAGINFIKNITDDYDHSEYDMYLDMDVVHNLSFDNLIFRKAVYEEVNKITKENFEFFNANDIEEISSGSTYIIETGNEIIGKVRLEIIDDIGGIYGLEILPDYRGKGFGRELLIQSINKLKEYKVKTVNLQVETENRNALNLYKSCGFKENYIMDYYRLIKGI
ncbi:MAG TPA: GNAT family N-acetyltransferase [Sedimentibacter sp.]|nr:GNAT family N-acetyltransferase [Sedimentibacter sp.]